MRSPLIKYDRAFCVLSCFMANWKAKAVLSVLQNESRHRWALPLSQEPWECFIYTHNTALNAFIIVKLSPAISPQIHPFLGPKATSQPGRSCLYTKQFIPVCHHSWFVSVALLPAVTEALTQRISGEGVIWAHGVRKCNPLWKGRNGGKSTV